MRSLYVHEGGKGLRDVQTLSSTKTTIASSRNRKERLLSTFTLSWEVRAVPAPWGFSVASGYSLLVLLSINNQRPSLGLGIFANKILLPTGPTAEKGQ